MKNQYEMRRTRELRARFDRMRREVEALEALPDVSGDIEPFDAAQFQDVSAALDLQDAVQPTSQPRVSGPVLFGLRG